MVASCSLEGTPTMVAFIDVLKGGEEVVTIGMSKKECVAT
jgi:hypothetical protein